MPPFASAFRYCRARRARRRALLMRRVLPRARSYVVAALDIAAARY